MKLWLKIADVLSWVWRLLLIGYMFYLLSANEIKTAFAMLLVYLLISQIDKGK